MRLVDDDDDAMWWWWWWWKLALPTRKANIAEKKNEKEIRIKYCSVLHIYAIPFISFRSDFFFLFHLLLLGIVRSFNWRVQWNTLWRSVKMEMIFASMRCEWDEWRWQKKEKRITKLTTRHKVRCCRWSFFSTLFSFMPVLIVCVTAWKCGLQPLSITIRQ